jgi:hypothetical protein
MMIKPGEEIIDAGAQRLRVLAVVPFDEEDESPFVGMLKVEAVTPKAVSTPRLSRAGSDDANESPYRESDQRGNDRR